MTKVEERQGKKLVSDMIAGFIQRNRKGLVVCITAAFVIVAAVIAGISIRNIVERNAIGRLEALNDRYESLRFNINESAQADDVRVLLEELTVFADKNSAYAGSRACSLIGSIHADQKNWADAEQAWLKAAKKGGKSYLTPAALYNAAVAAEEGGNLEKAIEHLRECISYQNDFPAAVRAQFTIGRLQETLRLNEDAIESYRTLIEKWPSEKVWTNLANSRIIILSGLNS
ncbi:MAG: tetratricopeptide repeat protein [Treponema sp.]|jgi:tetratricopeptide (TPR) repeat protein|nr:tetratricopeptide repeat protein [Treponema sp.]